MYKKVALGFMSALILIPAVCLGQDGTDINQAVPAYFGQSLSGALDVKTKPDQVYSIAMSKGQTFTVTAQLTGGQSPSWAILIAAPDSKQLGDLTACSNYLANEGCGSGTSGSRTTTHTVTYQAATSGKYYLIIRAYSSGIAYNLQLAATGTPLLVPNPAQAGCLTGQVDSITYSAQLIAASLPDEASIGGSRMCATCAVKPPAFPELVAKLESAMGMNVGVSACYDGAGNIFQLKLIHP